MRKCGNKIVLIPNGNFYEQYLTFWLQLYTIWPNLIKIGWFILLLSCLQTNWTNWQTPTQTDRKTHRQTKVITIPLHFLWRGKNTLVKSEFPGIYTSCRNYCTKIGMNKKYIQYFVNFMIYYQSITSYQQTFTIWM